MGNALILEFFDELPERHTEDQTLEWRIRYQAACAKYRKQIAGRYFPSTLLRLLVTTDDSRTRRAAILALGLVGSLKSCNRPLADCLHDEDYDVRLQAVESLWQLWFRAAGDEARKELMRALRKRDMASSLKALHHLLADHPQFAEAHHQRGILHARTKDWSRCVNDCKRAVHLNPQHFAALSCMGQALMHLHKNRAALQAFRQALKIHPGLEGIEDAVRSLENSLGED